MSRNRRIISAIVMFAQVFVLAIILVASRGDVGAGATGSITVTGTVTYNTTNEPNVSVYAINTSTNVEYGPTNTDSSGQYTLSVDAGTYNFYFIPPSGSGLSSVVDNDITISANQTISVQLYQAQSSHIFSGYLYDQNGTPVPGVRVELGNGNPGSAAIASGVTDASGYFTMAAAAGTYSVNFAGGNSIWNGYSLASFNMDSFESPGNTNIAEDLTTTDVSQNFTIPFDTLAVTTTDGSGNVTSANVSVSGSGSVMVTSGSSSYTISQSVTDNFNTGTTGTAVVAMPQGADFSSGICATFTSSTKVCNQNDVETESGSASVTLSEPAPPATHVLSGYIYDQNNNPVSGVNVEATGGPSNASFSDVTNTSGYYSMTVTAGSYTMDFASSTGSTWGGYQVLGYNMDSFESPGNTNIAEDLTTTDVSQNFTIPFDTLAVTTTDGSGNPIGASVSGSGSGAVTVATGTSTYTISQSVGVNLSTGSTGTVVVAMPQGASFTSLCATYANGTRVCNQSDPSTMSGSSSVTLSEPATHVFSGYLYDQNGAPVSGIRVELGNGNPGSAAIASGVTDASGYYSMTAAAGTYSVDFAYSGNGNTAWDSYPVVDFNMDSFESPGNTNIAEDLTTTDVSQNFTIPFDTLTINTNDVSGNPTSAYGSASGSGSVMVTSGSSSYTIGQSVGASFTTGSTGTTTLAMPKGADFSTGLCATYADGTKVCSQSALDTRGGSAIVIFQQNGSVVTTPSAPTNLTAPSPTDQSPSLSWGAVSGASSYNIYSGNGTKIGTTSGTTFTDNNPSQGVNSYYVTAVNAAGESNHSNTLSVIFNTTPPTTTASLSPNPFSDGSYANPVTVTLSATASSGVSVTNTYYTVDGGSQQTYTSPFTVSGYGDHTITYWSTDSSGLTETANTKTFHIDQPPVIASIPNATINEGSTFTQSDSFTDPDSSSWTATVDYGDGSGSQPLSLSGTSFSLSHVYADEGTYTAQVTVTDSDGVSSSTTATVTVNNAPFTVNAITGIPTSPILTNSSGTATVNASAAFDDPGTSDTHTATWSWGDGSAPTTGTVSESNGSGTAAGSHMYTSAGVYVVTLTVTDDDGMSVTQTFQYASVENPSVPGSRFGAGVKFNSPAGADVASPSLTGEVKFAIQVWFTQGAIDSNSKVDMNFVAGNIDFKSTSVTEFISSNGLGTVTGTGTINGTGNYTFLVTGINSANPGGNTVRFQIKDASGNVVYDTQPGAADNVAPTTQITAGQVTVQ